jgi:hypothetical protein
MPIAPKNKLFSVCLEGSKKDIMIMALDSYLDSLESRQASRMIIREARWLKEEIEKMRLC